MCFLLKEYTISLNSSAGTKASTQGEDGNFRQRTRFLEHCPVILSPTSEKKITYVAALTLNFAYKNLSLRSSHCFSVDQEPDIVSMRMQVPSLASLSGLRIWCCYGCGVGLGCSSSLTPSLGTSICCRCDSKKKTKKQNNNNNKNFSLKTNGEFGLWSPSHPFSLLGPARNLSLLQTPLFRLVWPHCVGGTNPGLVTHS